MTDFASPAPFASQAALEPLRSSAVRHEAFRLAGRHTSRVRLLRRLIAAGSTLALAGILGFAFFNPFRLSIPSVSIDSLGLNGTKVSMDKPKLAGFKSDGRPYTLIARSAVQDARTPSVLELVDLDAHITLSDKSVAHVVSGSGIYDSSKETMTFPHDVHLTTDAGMDVRMASGYVEFKSGIVDTQDPLTVVMNTGTVSADAMHMTDNGKSVTFEGHVHTIVLPADTGAKASASLKGSAP